MERIFFAQGLSAVMPGLVPGIHVFAPWQQERRGWPGHRRFVETPFFERLCPAMTNWDSSVKK
jgi:hypothetical protein